MPTNHRFIARTAVIASALSMGATAFALPAVASSKPAASASAHKLPITAANLSWGFKESFREYIVTIAAGTVTVGHGATQAPNNGVFDFSHGKGTYDARTRTSSTDFGKESVHFLGHGGILDITLADLKVNTGATAGTITADVTIKGNGPTVRQQDVALADLDLSSVKPVKGRDGAVVLNNIPGKLTAIGAHDFGDVYPVGEPLDPATLTLKDGNSGPHNGHLDRHRHG